jgi:hypothetical protein
VSAVGLEDGRRAENRWLIGGLVAVALVFVGQLAGGLVRADEPSYLAKVETCLTERSTAFDAMVGDPVALSADRGALRTSVGGNGVTVALGGSESDARRIFGDYEAVGSPGARLEQRRKVVFLWDQPPTGEQRDFMVLCTLDAQE